MQLELVPLAQREQRADDEDAPRALVEMRPGPDLAPGIARDQVLKFGAEGAAVLLRLVDPGIAEDFSALAHAAVAALLIVHRYLLRHSGMREAQTRNLEVPGSMLRIAPERRAQLALHQESDHRVGEGVRLFDVGDMRGVEDG